MVEAVKAHPRTIVIGAIAVGKTFGAALIAIWWLFCHRPARVFVIAPTYRQAALNFFGYMAQLIESCVNKFARPEDLLTSELRLGKGWFCNLISTRNPEFIKGIHGQNDLIIVDDGQGIEPIIWDAIDNALAGGNSKLLVLANSNDASGEVYQAQTSKRHRYHIIRITAWQSLNVRFKRTIVNGLVSWEWVADLIKTFGRDSDVVRTKVDAKEMKEAPDAVIPLTWIEKAKARTPQAFKDMTGELMLWFGIDVARYGNDKTVFTIGIGDRVLWRTKIKGNDTVEVASRALQLARYWLKNGYAHGDEYADLEMERDPETGDYELAKISHVMIAVDTGNMGSGVYDTLVHDTDEDDDIHIIPVDAGANPLDETRKVDYRNNRNWMWFLGREVLHPKNGDDITIEFEDTDLEGELSTATYRPGPKGKNEVEKKELMAERLKRSPDSADSFLLALLARHMLHLIEAEHWASEVIEPDEPRRFRLGR